jgi:alpha-glucosidase
LLVNFHGANKPTGESRTWPNEMTREGIRGLEHGRTTAWAEYNTIVPFARFLAGPADYTPLIFGDRRKDTTWTHQIATAIVFTSPVMVYAANPKSVLENPAAEVIKSIPSVWDETLVLPGSEIGEAAAFARRSGERWFVGVLNGPSAHKLRVSLSFLKQGSYRATTVCDKGDGSAVEIEQRTIGRKEVLELALRPGGGFVARFSPQGL